jgi:hypothetical protein
VSRVPWLIITGSRLVDWNYFHLLQSSLIIILLTHNQFSAELFFLNCRGFHSVSRSTTDCKVKVILRLTVSLSVSLGVEHHLGLMMRYLLQFDSYSLVFVWRPLWREDWYVFFLYMMLVLVSAVFLWSESLGTRPYFTVSDLRFPFSSLPTTLRITVDVFGSASTRVFDWLLTTFIVPYNTSARTTQKTRLFPCNGYPLPLTRRVHCTLPSSWLLIVVTRLREVFTESLLSKWYGSQYFINKLSFMQYDELFFRITSRWNECPYTEVATTFQVKYFLILEKTDEAR